MDIDMYSRRIGLLLSQWMELQEQIEGLDDINKDFLTTYYWDIFSYLQYMIQYYKPLDSVLTEDQKIKLDQLKADAKVLGSPDDLADFLLVKLKDAPSDTIAAFFATYRKSISLLLGKGYTDSYYIFLERLPHLAILKTIRSSNPQSHMEKAAMYLRLIHDFSLRNFDLILIIRSGTGGDTWPYKSGAFPLLVAEIERGNTEMIGYISDTLMGGEDGGQISKTIIKAVLSAGNTTLHEQLGKLLLAARLQEGLRSAILEPAASYSPEAFLQLLDVVNKNDLIRFSSVKKAIGKWLGLGVERSKSDRVFTKLLALITESLANSEARQKAIQGRDALELLAGLWAITFYDATQLYSATREIISSGDRHRMKVVAYYLLNTSIKTLQKEAAKKVLLQYSDDIELCSAFDCLFFRPVHISDLPNNVFNTLDYDYCYHNDNDPKLESFFTDAAEAVRFYHIYSGLVRRMDTDSVTAELSGISWYSTTMKRQQLLLKMLCIIHMTRNFELVDDYIKYWNVMSPEIRVNTVHLLLCCPKNETQWNMLITALGDKSRYPRLAAFKCLSELSIPPENMLKIEGYLKLKSGDLRQKALTLLLKQPPEQLLETLRRLLASPSREMRQGGLSLAMEIKQSSVLSGIHGQAEALVSGLTDTTHTEKTLAGNITAENKAASNDNTTESAFGLADPTSRPALPAIECDFNLRDAFPLAWDKMPELLNILDKLIQKHADFEYRDRSGQPALVGNDVTWLWQSEFQGLDDIPLADVWRGFYSEHIKDPRVLFQLYLFRQMDFYDYTYIEPFERILERIYGSQLYEVRKRFTRNSFSSVSFVLGVLYNSYVTQSGEAFIMATRFCSYIWNSITPDEHWVKIKSDDVHIKSEDISIFAYNHIRFLFDITESWKNDEEFTAAFALWYAFHIESLCKKSDDYYAFSMLALAKAINLGLMPFNELILEMTCRKDAPLRLRDAYDNVLNKHDDRYTEDDRAVLRSAIVTVVDKLVNIELARGDSVTVASPFVPYIREVVGIPRLISLLRAIGESPLVRAKDSWIYNCYFEKDIGRLESLSCLLFFSCPADGETSDKLAEALQNTDISNIRLVELAMYNYRWTKLIGEYLGWDGFEAGCWYFRAHMNEWFSKEAVAEIEKYTPIPIYDLREGAFDALWFEKISKKLGEKRFELLYDAAKYTAAGAKHARARKFADAVRGKLDIPDTRRQVGEKRNKDLLLAYSLIPLRDKNDLLDRYLFLQSFLKESRQFGKQRQESEKLTVQTSMGNLARTAGYSDITRLTWAMEALTFEMVRQFFEPRKIGDFDVYINVDGDGKSCIVCLKDGKPLKSVPAALKKDETVSEMQKLCKSQNDQHKRARIMLENAMIEESPFETLELRELFKNPVVFPLISNLVFRHGDSLGYFRDGALKDITGSVLELADSDALVIAHPIHLYKSDNWSAWQRDLFGRQIRQPFKQVFRELYLKLPEEMDTYDTCRYEGNQVQQRQAYTLLTSRRWSEAGYSSMQKVFHKQDTFVELNISADWNTPAEIEPMALSSVEFYAYYDNIDGHGRERRKPISEISEIAFSEAMRDVDLVVSVAHAGRVDPQFSHSTVEMRNAIARCTLDLLGIKNVRLEGTHAFVDGKLASYIIHLGSGVIHQTGGSMISVLPIHSQQRGRIFLPFIDDDPKTAEIISKILLFADDSKIKDPSILRQINR